MTFITIIMFYVRKIQSAVQDGLCTTMYCCSHCVLEEGTKPFNPTRGKSKLGRHANTHHTAKRVLTLQKYSSAEKRDLAVATERIASLDILSPRFCYEKGVHRLCTIPNSNWSTIYSIGIPIC